MTEKPTGGRPRAPSRDAPQAAPPRNSDNDFDGGNGELPKPRRNYALAIAAALIVFVLLVAIRVLSDLGGGPTVPSLPGSSPTNAPETAD